MHSSEVRRDRQRTDGRVDGQERQTDGRTEGPKEPGTVRVPGIPVRDRNSHSPGFPAAVNLPLIPPPRAPSPIPLSPPRPPPFRAPRDLLIAARDAGVRSRERASERAVRCRSGTRADERSDLSLSRRVYFCRWPRRCPVMAKAIRS